jgi:hypothetical protein
VKTRKSLTISAIVLLLALLLVAGVQAEDGLYAQSVFNSYNVEEPGFALGAPDGDPAALGLDGGTAALGLDMGQEVCGPLYVYALPDSVGSVSVSPDDPTVGPPTMVGMGWFSRDDQFGSTYEEQNGRWVIDLYAQDSDDLYTGAIRAVSIENDWSEPSLILVFAVEASPCGSEPQPQFGGFLPPIAGDGDALNAAKAGRAVPVNFDLGGDFGLDILESTSVRVPCDSEQVSGEEVPTVSAGASGLTYDPETGLYTYVWKTDKLWSGTCRQLLLTIDDETYSADFKFK